MLKAQVLYLPVSVPLRYSLREMILSFDSFFHEQNATHFIDAAIEIHRILKRNTEPMWGLCLQVYEIVVNITSK